MSGAKKLTYQEKLRDPRWQKKRLQILERDGWACRLCGDKEKTLHVHHVHYDSRADGPWDYPDTSLVTLCCECHEGQSEDLPIYRNEFIERVAAAGFWRAGHFSLLADAFYAKTPMNEEEVDYFAAMILDVVQSRNAHLAKKAGDPNAEQFTREDLWLNVVRVYGPQESKQ
jgi:hypothetical protein